MADKSATFQIACVETGADSEYLSAGGIKLHHFIIVEIKIMDGFDWERDGKALMARIERAAKLNDTE